MPLTLDKKKHVIKEIKEKSLNSYLAIVAEYTEINSNDMNDIRKIARKMGIFFKVAHNNLAKISFKNTKFNCLNTIIGGPTILTLSEDALGGIPAKFFIDLMETNKTLKVKALSLNGECLGGEELDKISKIPCREEAIILLRNSLKFISKRMVYVTQEIPRRIVNTIFNISKKID